MEAKGWTSTDLLKLAGLTVLFAILLSINYSGLALSSAASKLPLQVVLVSFVDTVVLSYFVTSSRWTGRKEWGALFALLYGMVYVLTAIESVYLGSLLSASTVFTLLVNGGITSTVFAAALVWAFGEKRAWRVGWSASPDARKGMGMEDRGVCGGLSTSLHRLRSNRLHASR